MSEDKLTSGWDRRIALVPVDKVMLDTVIYYGKQWCEDPAFPVLAISTPESAQGPAKAVE